MGLDMRRGSLKGFDGSINRVVKIKGTKKEYFITGSEESTFEEVLQKVWPFEDHKMSEKWRVISSTGEDLTKTKFKDHSNTVIVEFF